MIKFKKIMFFFTAFIFLAGLNLLYAGPAPKSGQDIEIKPGPAQASGDGVVFSGADEGEYIKLSDSGEGSIVLRGNIKMVSGNMALYARHVVYNRETGDITFSEDVHYTDGANVLEAEKCVYNVKGRAGVLYNAVSSEEPLIFDADKVRIVDKNSYIAEDLDLTTCDMERPHYHFLVSKLWIYSDRRAVAYNAVYVVGDIPIFYLPVLVQTDEGIGIITQLGQSDRRGNFMQNTINYVSGNRDKWKYKLDIYEKLGYYGGIDYIKTTSNFYLDIYLGAARYKPVDGNLNNTTLLPEENWYKTIVKSDGIFFKREASNTYYNLNFEWMNNWDFERQFDNRNEPETTLEIIRAPLREIDSRRYLKWIYTLGDRGDRHKISLTFERQWRWNDTLTSEDVGDYNVKGLYMPHIDRLPVFGLNYNNSFFLFGKPEKKSDYVQIVNWDIYLGGESYKQYNLGEHFKTYYRPSGYFNIYTVFPLVEYVTYSPGIKMGFYAEWVKDPNEETRETSEIAADKNSYQYLETSNALKFGLINYYLQFTHYYRRSYLEREVVEPFIHEKRNYFEGGLFLFPFDGIDMSVTTGYDARRKFPFDDERWRDIEVKNNFFLDFYKYINNTVSGKNRGLFFSGLIISNDYKYITKAKTPGYNILDVSYTTGNFTLPGIKLIKSIEVGYNFFHDFRYSFRDMMSIKWGLNVEISKLWRAGIQANSQADRAYLYYDEEHDENIFDDIEKTVYYYDRDRSKGAVFTLRNLNISIIHDLHCWELGLYYDIRRQIEKVGPGSKDRFIYYDQSVFVSLTLKTFAGKGLDKTQVYPLDDASRREY